MHRYSVAAVTAALVLLTWRGFDAQSGSSLALVFSERTVGFQFDALARGQSGSIWAVSYTSSSSVGTTPGALQPTSRGAADILLSRYDNSGALLYRTYLGG